MSLAERTVLVVDDEAQVRQLTCRALSACGFQCDQAQDGAEAISMASDRSYDAVVTDLRMPHRHGHALCTDLMELPKPPKVLVLTALGDARLTRDLLVRGVRDVVQKPVQYDVLAMKVLAMVEGPNSVESESVKERKPRAALKINLLQKIETTLTELTDLFTDKLESVYPPGEELPEPPKAVRDYIRRLSAGESQGQELPGDPSSRNNERVTCCTTAIAVPVNRHWKPVCEPFKVALRDLSESGVRLLHTRATTAGYLALSWPATQLASREIRVVVQVVRCRPCSRFYDIGGVFTMAD